MHDPPTIPGYQLAILVPVSVLKMIYDGFIGVAAFLRAVKALEYTLCRYFVPYEYRLHEFHIASRMKSSEPSPAEYYVGKTGPYK